MDAKKACAVLATVLGCVLVAGCDGKESADGSTEKRPGSETARASGARSLTVTVKKRFSVDAYGVSEAVFAPGDNGLAVKAGRCVVSGNCGAGLAWSLYRLCIKAAAPNRASGKMKVALPCAFRAWFP